MFGKETPTLFPQRARQLVPFLVSSDLDSVISAVIDAMEEMDINPEVIVIISGARSLQMKIRALLSSENLGCTLMELV